MTQEFLSCEYAQCLALMLLVFSVMNKNMVACGSRSIMIGFKQLFCVCFVLQAQIHELKQSQTPSTSQLKSTLLDPSVNLLFEKMKTELGETKEKLEQAQNDLSAWKFTPDRFVILTYLNQMKNIRKESVSRELEHKLISQDEQMNCITRDAQCAVLKTLINFYFQVNDVMNNNEVCSQGQCCLVNIKSKTYCSIFMLICKDRLQDNLCINLFILSCCILDLWVKIASDLLWLISALFQNPFYQLGQDNMQYKNVT